MPEFSVEDLALESIELLPDRDTMQPILIGSFATNVAAVSQTATSGPVSAAVDVQGGGDVQLQVVSAATNSATITQTATSGDVTVAGDVPG
jgi:hypothetical protein